MPEYFFEMPSFLRGVSRALDLGSGLHKGSYLISDSPAEADARALASDFAAVDADLAAAAESLVVEQKESSR